MDFSVTRSPTLRDLVDIDRRPHSAFMHDSSLPMLMDVVSHYANINTDVPNLDSRLLSDARSEIGPFSEQGKAALVSFLKTLTGSGVYTDPKWSDPFSPDGHLDLRVISDDSLDFHVTSLTSGQRPDLELRFRLVPNLAYFVEASDDLKTWVSLGFVIGPVGTEQRIVPMKMWHEKRFHRLVFKMENQPLLGLP